MATAAPALTMEVTLFGRVISVVITVEDLRFDSDRWQISNTWICKFCKDPALIHPKDNRIWACRTCFVKKFGGLFEQFKHINQP